jgi:hypothetical protein
VYVNVQVRLQLESASAVFKRNLSEEVLLVRDRAGWQDANVEVLALLDVLGPGLVVEKVVQSNLVLDETLPAIDPLVADQVPILVLSHLFVCADHQLALNLAALHH